MNAKELGSQFANPTQERTSDSFADEYFSYKLWRGGLTKREYFAGLAMQGFITEQSRTLDAVTIAIFARQHADALLEELAKTST